MIKTLFCCNGGEIIAWSRILDDEEILCIVNSNAQVEDLFLHPATGKID
jgi:hypothetical protein